MPKFAQHQLLWLWVNTQALGDSMRAPPRQGNEKELKKYIILGPLSLSKPPKAQSWHSGQTSSCPDPLFPGQLALSAAVTAPALPEPR